MKKRERILLLIIFLAAGGLWLTNRFIFSEPAARVEVTTIDRESGKTITESFALEKDRTFTIVTEPEHDGESKGTNLLVIENGTVWISEANCPNQDCVKQGTIRQNGEMLVCLPHKVTVSIVGN